MKPHSHWSKARLVARAAALESRGRKLRAARTARTDAAASPSQQQQDQRAVLEIIERERRNIGDELHDDLCQQLASIELLAEGLRADLAPHSRADSARAKEIARLVRQANQRTRELARGLVPVTLEPGGLMGALRDLAKRTEALFGIKCRFQGRAPVLVLDKEMDNDLYRIAQEAVSNAVKHGKPRRVDIRLRPLRGRVVLTIKDDGIGLQNEALPSRSNGMGLLNMEYRAGRLQGSLTVRRQEGRGTTVVCSAPVRVRGPASSSS